MYFKLAFKHIKRRPFVTLIMIFMFSVAIYLCGTVFQRFIGYFDTTTTAKNFCNENSYYISSTIEYTMYIEDKQFELMDEYLTPLHDAVNNGEITQEEFKKEYNIALKKFNEECKKLQVQKTISELPYIQKDSFIAYGNLLVDDKQSIYNESELGFLSKDYADTMNKKLSSGKWFNEAEQSDEYLNIIALTGFGFSTGDIIDLNYIKDTYNEDTLRYSTETTSSIKAKVIGVVDDDMIVDLAGVYNSNGSKDGESEVLSQFVNKVKYNGIYAIYDLENPLLKDLDPEVTEINAHVVELEPNLSDEQLEEFNQSVSDSKYYKMSMKNCYDNTYRYEMGKMQNDIVFLVSAILISLVGIVGITALNFTRDIKTYAVYYINGMKWKNCLVINGISMAFILIASSLISFLIKLGLAYYKYRSVAIEAKKISIELNYPYEDIHSPFSRFFNFANGEIAFLIILTLVTLVIAMLIPYGTFRKTQPTELLKGN